MSDLYELVSSNENSTDTFAFPHTQSRRKYWAISLGTISLANLCMLVASLYYWRAVGYAASATPDVSRTTLTLD
jgi:hypothetical protein